MTAGAGRLRPCGMASLDKPDIGTSTVRWRWPSVHPEGYKFAAIAALITLLFFVCSWRSGWAGSG